MAGYDPGLDQGMMAQLAQALAGFRQRQLTAKLNKRPSLGRVFGESLVQGLGQAPGQFLGNVGGQLVGNAFDNARQERSFAHETARDAANYERTDPMMELPRDQAEMAGLVERPVIQGPWNEAQYQHMSPAEAPLPRMRQSQVKLTFESNQPRYEREITKAKEDAAALAAQHRMDFEAEQAKQADARRMVDVPNAMAERYGMQAPPGGPPDLSLDNLTRPDTPGSSKYDPEVLRAAQSSYQHNQTMGSQKERNQIDAGANELAGRGMAVKEGALAETVRSHQANEKLAGEKNASAAQAKQDAVDYGYAGLEQKQLETVYQGNLSVLKSLKKPEFATPEQDAAWQAQYDHQDRLVKAAERALLDSHQSRGTSSTVQGSSTDQKKNDPLSILDRIDSKLNQVK